MKVIISVVRLGDGRGGCPGGDGVWRKFNHLQLRMKGSLSPAQKVPCKRTERIMASKKAKSGQESFVLIGELYVPALQGNTARKYG